MRYYFDIRDGNDLVRDDVGVELPNVQAAHTEAAVAITEMARDYLPTNGPHREFVIQVRSSAGIQFKVTLDYDVEDNPQD